MNTRLRLQRFAKIAWWCVGHSQHSTTLMARRANDISLSMREG
jgi:hypothetical protein